VMESEAIFSFDNSIFSSEKRNFIWNFLMKVWWRFQGYLTNRTTRLCWLILRFIQYFQHSVISNFNQDVFFMSHFYLKLIKCPKNHMRIDRHFGKLWVQILILKITWSSQRPYCHFFVEYFMR
jgi:hypothetical protein